MKLCEADAEDSTHSNIGARPKRQASHMVWIWLQLLVAFKPHINKLHHISCHNLAQLLLCCWARLHVQEHHWQTHTSCLQQQFSWISCTAALHICMPTCFQMAVNSSGERFCSEVDVNSAGGGGKAESTMATARSLVSVQLLINPLVKLGVPKMKPLLGTDSSSHCELMQLLLDCWGGGREPHVLVGTVGVWLAGGGGGTSSSSSSSPMLRLNHQIRVSPHSLWAMRSGSKFWFQCWSNGDDWCSKRYMCNSCAILLDPGY